MKMKTKKSGAALTVAVNGRIDTKTAPEFQTGVMAELDGVKELVLDFAEVNYVSSAGLRVLLFLNNKLGDEGEMKLIKVNQSVMDVFEVTGFSDILTIE